MGEGNPGEIRRASPNDLSHLRLQGHRKAEGELGFPVSRLTRPKPRVIEGADKFYILERYVYLAHPVSFLRS